jgi:energy-coupling factor transporter ATP-binding protein EcfA2
MTEKLRITSIRFRNYKAFSDYSISFGSFNVLVGPNNAGKSTVLGALRILSAGIRRARARTSDLIDGPTGHQVRGYPVRLEGLPISTENIFHNYDDSTPAIVDFRLSNGHILSLFFPSRGECFMVPVCDYALRSPSDFKRHFNVDIAFVPILGPVDHNEPIYEKEAARQALLSHGASRNFRNIWYHFPVGFDEFRKKIQETWPGMDIQPPELVPGTKKAHLCMFCPEDRYPREIFWAGFGFQVWCQMLTFILQAKDATALVIDEPDIYLHSDLQRQLVGLLEELGPQIIIATHSAEIIAEVEPRALLNVNKRFHSARHVRDTRELQQIFQVLGSNLNPVLTQLAKTRRVVFVEGKDFQILSRFARRLGLEAVANRSDFAVVPVEGYNPQKVKDFASGMETTLGARLLKVAIFDRDYRSDAEAAKVTTDLEKFCWLAVVHNRKELENFLLHPGAIERAIRRRLAENERRGATIVAFNEDISGLLMRLADDFKNHVRARMVSARQVFERTMRSSLDPVSISETAMNEFDVKWQTTEGRMKMVPGKELFSALNNYLQNQYKISLSPIFIIEAFLRDEICTEVRLLLEKLDELRKTDAPDQASLEFEPLESAARAD